MHRETVRAAIRALGYPDPDIVREVSIGRTRILVEHVALDQSGGVTLRNGEPVYTVTEHRIVEEHRIAVEHEEDQS